MVVTVVEQLSFRVSDPMADPGGNTFPWQFWQQEGDPVSFQKKPVSDDVQVMVRQPQQERRKVPGLYQLPKKNCTSY